jgi:hypothetical protein
MPRGPAPRQLCRAVLRGRGAGQPLRAAATGRVSVAMRTTAGRCTVPAARGANGADRLGRRSESEGGLLLAGARLGVGADGGGSLHRCGLALRRVEGHVKIRNQDFDSRNSKLRWQGTGKEATQPMRTWRRRRSPPPKRLCGSCGCGPCRAWPAAREVNSNGKQRQYI